MTERGRIHENKAPFRKQLSAQSFKVYSFVSLCERRVQNQHMVTVQWALFSSAQLMAIARCSYTGSYQTALHYCGRNLLDWG